MQDDETHKDIEQECVCSSDELSLCSMFLLIISLLGWWWKALIFLVWCTHWINCIYRPMIIERSWSGPWRPGRLTRKCSWLQKYKGHAEWIMWHQWSHRPARQEPSNPPAALTLSSGARWRFSCPPMERHHRGLLHFVLPIIKQCIKTSNQSTPTVSLSFEMKGMGESVRALCTPQWKSTF